MSNGFLVACNSLRTLIAITDLPDRIYPSFNGNVGCSVNAKGYVVPRSRALELKT